MLQITQMGLIVEAYDFCVEKKRGGNQTPTQTLMGLQSKKSQLNVSSFNTKRQLDNVSDASLLQLSPSVTSQ